MLKNKFIGQIREYNRYAEGTITEEFKLDLIDRKILYILGENARVSNTFLAKKLKVKRATVAYRIKRMTDADFLHGYLTLLDHRKLGFKNYIVYLKLKTLTNEEEIINQLHVIDKITRLKNCSGTYDLQIVFSVKAEEEFLDLFEGIVNKYHTLIQSYDIFEIIDEKFLGLNLVLSKEDIKQLDVMEHKGSTFQREFQKLCELKKVGDENINFRLDDKDKQLLDILILNGKIPITELANGVSLAPIAVENRVKKLVTGGVIKGFIPMASLNKLGYQWWKLFFKFKNLDKQKFMTFVRYHSNVLWCMRLLGKWDYQFSVFAKDNAEFHKVLDEIRSNFSDNIISYDSIIVFNQFKYVQRV